MKARGAEFHQFLREPDDFYVRIVQPVLDENVTGNARDVFLHKHVAAGEVVHAVR